MFNKRANTTADRVTVGDLQTRYMDLLARVKSGERLVLSAPLMGDLVAIVPLADLERLERQDTSPR